MESFKKIIDEQTASQHTLITAMENNRYAYTANIHQGVDDIWVADLDNLLLISTGLVCRARLPEPEWQVQSIIKLVKAYFGQDRRSFSWWVSPNTKPATLAGILEKNSFIRSNTEIGMFVNLRNYRPPFMNMDHFSISVVDSPESLNDYITVFTEYWDVPNHGIREMIMKSGGDILKPDAPTRLYIGYFQEEPVTVCTMFQGEGVAGIYSVTTLKKMRRLGFASRLLSAPLLDASNNGYEFATLQSSPMLKSLYHQQGFQELCMFHEYRFKYDN